MSDLIERLQRYADGVLGKSELKVGPHMCADAFCEARDALSSLKAEVEELRTWASWTITDRERQADYQRDLAIARAESAEREAEKLREALTSAERQIRFTAQTECSLCADCRTALTIEADAARQALGNQR